MDEEKILKFFQDQLGLFRNEVKQGFSDLSIRMDETNARLDETNARLDQTIVRLDQTNVRLDAAITMVRDFRKDVSVKLDGIGSHLISINGNLLKHEERIRSLEERVDRLENTG